MSQGSKTLLFAGLYEVLNVPLELWRRLRVHNSRAAHIHAQLLGLRLHAQCITSWGRARHVHDAAGRPPCRSTDSTCRAPLVGCHAYKRDSHEPRVPKDCIHLTQHLEGHPLAKGLTLHMFWLCGGHHEQRTRTASGWPRRMMWACPRRSSSAAAFRMRGSSASGKTMRCGCGSMTTMEVRGPAARLWGRFCWP